MCIRDSVYLGYILLITVLPINSQNSSSKYFLTTDMTFAAFVTIALLVEFASLHRLLVPPLRYCAGVHQQLHQSFHLRRNLPWVPARHQTYDSTHHRKFKSDSAAAEQQRRSSDVKPGRPTGPRHRHHLRWGFLFSRPHSLSHTSITTAQCSLLNSNLVSRQILYHGG